MAAPYQSILQVPTFVPRNQESDYKSWLQMMKDTEGSRAELAGKKMDTLSGLLSRIPGFTDIHQSAQNLIGSALKGELTDTHRQVLEQQAAAQRVSQGVQGGAGAGVNMSLASFGRAGLAAQQQALASVPQFMAFSQNAFMGNIANDPSVTGPSWGSWGGQLQADTRDVYESKLAQAKALHQVQQMNEQFTVQENQRMAAQARLDETARVARQDMFAQAAVNRQNAAYGGVMQGAYQPYQSTFQSRMSARYGPMGSRGGMWSSPNNGANSYGGVGGWDVTSYGGAGTRSYAGVNWSDSQGGSAQSLGSPPPNTMSLLTQDIYMPPKPQPNIDNPFRGGMNFDNLY